MKASVVLEWDVEPQFCVDQTAEGLEVVADLSLSEDQVASACAVLGEHGDDVLQAWRRAVGLDSGGSSASSGGVWRCPALGLGEQRNSPTC